LREAESPRARYSLGCRAPCAHKDAPLRIGRRIGSHKSPSLSTCTHTPAALVTMAIERSSSLASNILTRANSLACSRNPHARAGATSDLSLSPPRLRLRSRTATSGWWRRVTRKRGHWRCTPSINATRPRRRPFAGINRRRSRERKNRLHLLRPRFEPCPTPISFISAHWRATASARPSADTKLATLAHRANVLKSAQYFSKKYAPNRRLSHGR